MIKHKICVFERDEIISDYIKLDEATVEWCTSLCIDEKCKSCYLSNIIVVDMNSFDAREVTTFLVNKTEQYTIVVNAKENMKYQLYECGAADVMIGAIDKLELKYKITSKIRFYRSINKAYQLGDILFDVDTRTLKREDKSVTLPALQNKIFTLLIRDYYGNKFLQKEEIFDTMVDESGRIQNHIARLRYSLSYIGSDKVTIETIYGRGYKLCVSE